MEYFSEKPEESRSQKRLRSSLDTCIANNDSLAYWFLENPKRIELISKELLNEIIIMKPNIGVSVLFLLLISHGGVELLYDSKELRSKVTPEGLNSSVTRGSKKGMSALYVLVCRQIGRNILLEDKSFAEKVTNEGLNKQLSTKVSRHCPEKSSVLWMICRFHCFALFEKYPRWLTDISKKVLNTIILDSKYRGQSILWYLTAFAPKILLQGQQAIIDKITVTGLNMPVCPLVQPRGGTSALFYIFGRPELFSVVQSNNMFFEKITKKGLNALPCIGASPLGQLISHKGGQLLLESNRNLQNKITQRGLYTICTKGALKGLSTFAVMKEIYANKLLNILPGSVIGTDEQQTIKHNSIFLSSEPSKDKHQKEPRTQTR